MSAPSHRLDPASIDRLGPWVQDGERDAHLAAVEARRAAGFPLVAARAAEIEARFPAEARIRHYGQLQAMTSRDERIVWLRRGADLTLDAAAGASACARGCAHCCHIPVSLSEREARLIGREIGREPAAPAEAAEPAATRYTGVPCTFLSAAGECTIYASRPLACRRAINLDVDALLCRLVPGAEIDQAYLDQRLEQALERQAVGAGALSRYADVREWFPVAERS